MRVTSPAVTIKAIWDALVAEYGVAGSYGLLLETNLDAKVSLAKAKILGENLLENPGFETGDETGWTQGGTGSMSVQAVTVKYGTYAADINPDAGQVYFIFNTDHVPCYADRRVRVQAWMKADADIASSWLNLFWLDAAGVYLSETISPDYGGNYDWAFRKHVATAPDGAYFVQAVVRLQSGGAAGHGYADSVALPSMAGDNVEVLDELGDAVYGLAALEGLVDELETRLTDARAALIDDIGKGALISASDTGPLLSSDAEVTESVTSYVKKKEFLVTVPGTYRIKFDLAVSNALATGNGRIYKNGAALGTERSTSSESYVTYSEDLGVGVNDLIQLYLKTDTYLAKAQNFRLYGTLGTGVGVVTLG